MPYAEHHLEQLNVIIPPESVMYSPCQISTLVFKLFPPTFPFPLPWKEVYFNSFSKYLCRIKGEKLNVSCCPVLIWLQQSNEGVSHLYHYIWMIKGFENLGRWKAFHSKSHPQSVWLTSYKIMSALNLGRIMWRSLIYTTGLKQDKMQVIKAEFWPSCPATDQNLYNASASPGPHFLFFVVSG